MKQELLDALEKLGDRLPPNTLDQLVDQLGGPDCVAEVRLNIVLLYPQVYSTGFQ
jgi:hypothetical protein